MEISINEAKKLLTDSKVVFLDVRTYEERISVKIDPSVHVNLFDDNFEDKIRVLDKSFLYIVYCRTGNRSSYVVDFMNKEGFNAKNLSGGVNDWFWTRLSF